MLDKIEDISRPAGHQSYGVRRTLRIEDRDIRVEHPEGRLVHLIGRNAVLCRDNDLVIRLQAGQVQERVTRRDIVRGYAYVPLLARIGRPHDMPRPGTELGQGGPLDDRELPVLAERRDLDDGEVRPGRRVQGGHALLTGPGWP